jgi:hypothetical protein
MNTASASRTMLLALWALALVMIPFYFFGQVPMKPLTQQLVERMAKEPIKVESGVPQVADFVFAGLIALTLATMGVRLNRGAVPVVKLLACFVVYTVLVNGLWTLLEPGAGFALLRNSLFYTYDFLLLLTFLTLYAVEPEKMLRWTVYAVMASVFLQVLLSPLSMQMTSLRQKLYFNNSNQLGFYAVLTASIFFLGSKHIPVRPWLQAAFYLAVTFLAVLSLSKAALFALGLLLLAALVRRPLLLLFSAVALGGLFLIADTSLITDRLETRFFSDDGDETLAKRGYDRMFHHPEYLVFGAGEGKNDRFLTEHKGELHSSFGTILFCYGIIGIGFFAGAVVTLCRRVRWEEVFCLVPVFVYGLAHHGLRATLFWALVAFLCCLARSSQTQDIPEPVGTGSAVPQAEQPEPALAG